MWLAQREDMRQQRKLDRDYRHKAAMDNLESARFLRRAKDQALKECQQEDIRKYKEGPHELVKSTRESARQLQADRVEARLKKHVDRRAERSRSRDHDAIHLAERWWKADTCVAMREEFEAQIAEEKKARVVAMRAQRS